MLLFIFFVFNNFLMLLKKIQFCYRIAMSVSIFVDFEFDIPSASIEYTEDLVIVDLVKPLRISKVIFTLNKESWQEFKRTSQIDFCSNAVLQLDSSYEDFWENTFVVINFLWNYQRFYRKMNCYDWLSFV